MNREKLLKLSVLAAVLLIISHSVFAETVQNTRTVLDLFLEPDVRAKPMARMWFPDAAAGGGTAFAGIFLSGSIRLYIPGFSPVLFLRINHQYAHAFFRADDTMMTGIKQPFASWHNLPRED